MISEGYSAHVLDKTKQRYIVLYIDLYIYLKADMTIPKQLASKIMFSLFLLFMHFIKL